MSDEFERLSDVLGADQARRILEEREREASELADRARVDAEQNEYHRKQRHHDAVMMFVKHRLDRPEPVSGGELAEWAHLMADYLYPPPGSVFEPELLHYRNPPPKAEDR